MEGNYTTHTLYGRQFQVTSATAGAPKDAVAMEKYLGSGAIKGIGESLAKRIVTKFGDKTFEIIEKEPERLVEIKGISERIARQIYEQFQEKHEAREAMIYLQQFGLSTNMAMKIYKAYGARMKDILTNNPYRLAEDVQGIGFKHADEIAVKLGFEADSEFRIRAGIIYTLTLGSNSGHSYLPQEVLYRHASDMMGCDASNFDNIIDELCITKKIVVKLYGEVRRVYLASYYYTELAIARMLSDLNVKEILPESEISARVVKVEKKLGITLDGLQREALNQALVNCVFILTGGPGTGKTTTINAMIEMFELEGMNVLLAAPTGRAAKRMSEATGREARTIHRMLEFAPTGGDMENSNSPMSFQRNEENPLDADVIIIDETSMVDMHLMNALLRQYW
jgi:exodeoxyribonuclease V alpha subunit